MPNILILDTEATGALTNKAHPFDPRNKLCLVGFYLNGEKGQYNIEYSPNPYGHRIGAIQALLNECDLLVLINAKHDLHWLRRYGIILPKKLKVWDCQQAHFLLTNQRHTYPSMDDMAEHYGLPQKPSEVKEYWANGYDTDQIPLPLLMSYLDHDLDTTKAIYERQVVDIEKAGLTSLMTLCCADLLVIEEMEWNGMKYDNKKSLEKAKELRSDIDECISRLDEAIGTRCIVNWESPEQLSKVLYGGTITHKTKEEAGVFKTGARVGQPRFSIRRQDYTFPQLVEPISGSETAKEGVWSVDEPTLRSLKAKGKAKAIIDLVLALAEKTKLCGTYYEGVPERFEKYQWENDILHHRLNTVVVVTGRLSSSDPNMQNQPKAAKECFISRYDQ